MKIDRRQQHGHEEKGADSIFPYFLPPTYAVKLFAQREEERREPDNPIYILADATVLSMYWWGLTTEDPNFLQCLRDWDLKDSVRPSRRPNAGVVQDVGDDRRLIEKHKGLVRLALAEFVGRVMGGGRAKADQGRRVRLSTVIDRLKIISESLARTPDAKRGGRDGRGGGGRHGGLRR